jgi:hypothetical protein
MYYTVIFYDGCLKVNGVDVKVSEASFDYLTDPPNVGEACLHVYVTIKNLCSDALNEDADIDPRYLGSFLADGYKIQFNNFELDLYDSDAKFLRFSVNDCYLITIAVEQSSMIREL